MAISKLCQGTALTDKRYDRWGQRVTRITPHQEVAHWTAETAAVWFRDNGIENSVNYCIGYDGSLWCNVDEDFGAWTSSSADNDRKAITIELSNNENIYSGQMTDATIEAFINLCVDLIRRHPGLGGRFNYTGDLSGNITLHEWFAATNCPGQWFKDKLPYIQQQVNLRLNTGYVTPWDVVNNFISGKNRKEVKKLFTTVFNPKYYCEKYPDVKKAYGTDADKLFGHFMSFGMGEGRRATEKFDPIFYQKNYPDLRKAFGSNLPAYYVHYMEFGKKEHRVAYSYNYIDNSDKGTKWYKPILWLYNNGMILPTTSNKFGIDNKTTKKFLALALWRRAGRPSPRIDSPYTDIDLKAATWCFEKGYITTEDREFHVKEGLTKSQVLEILWKAVGQPAIKGETSTEKAIAWARANKILRGKVKLDELCPKKTAALWFYRTFK